MAYRNIHVLLVETETRDLDNIINLLHYFSYRVTSVNLLSTALSILSKGKVQFDLVMVNMNSLDPLGIQLLQDASKMKLLVIVMSNVDDVVTTMRALEEGAFLCVRKPLSMSMLGSLWQFVLSEKSRRPKETQPFTKLINYHNYNSYILESTNNYPNYKNTHFQEKEKTGNNYSEREEGGPYKRKAWAEWTLDLHRKFMAAAKFLGEGRCYPNDILQLMNVPGLTRMQVASHLQKCRNANWLPPNERNSKTGNRERRPKKESKAPRARPLKFGVMPFSEEYNEDAVMNIPPTKTTMFGHDDHAESSNARALDHGFYLLGSDNMGFDHQQFGFGDYQTTDYYSPKLVLTEAPFELLPIMGEENLEMDLGENCWESFLLDRELHHQVPDVADGANQCSRDMENEQGQTRKG